MRVSPMTGLGPPGLEVAGVEGDTGGAAGPARSRVLLDRLGDPFGELDAAPLDADEHEIVGAMGELEPFYRHTLQRPRHGAGVQDDRAVGPAHLGGGS